MSLVLLDNIRKLKSIIYSKRMQDQDFASICAMLSDMLDSHVLLISDNGRVISAGLNNRLSFRIKEFKHTPGEFLDTDMHERVLRVMSTNERVDLSLFGVTDYASSCAMICPLIANDKRMGTLIVYRDQGFYQVDDVVTLEYAGAIISLSLLYAQFHQEDIESNLIAKLESGLASLSHAELLFVSSLPDHLRDNTEGVIKTAHIADSLHMSRSVVNSAMRKLASAGILDFRSCGMKGTHIKILNPYFLDRVRESKPLI